MSLSPLVVVKIDKSGKRLSQIKAIAGLFLENAIIKTDRHALEPLRQVDYSLAYMKESITQVATVSTEKSDTFLNHTTKRIKDKAYEIVGRSPGLIEDIAKAIVQPVQKIIDDALKPITNLLDAIPKTIKDFIVGVGETIVSGFGTVVNTVGGYIDSGFEAIGNGVTFVQKSVDGLLEGVASGITTFITAFQVALSKLATEFEAILKMTPEGILNFQKEIQRLIENEQANMIKTAMKGS